MATQRLRKQVEGRQDGNARENFCMIGTPLPSLDSKRDSNEYKPVWQQEVYDDQGRRRFHGAFTGGFSAGYFNTVGSKEGWVPSSFSSSRKDQKDPSKAFNQSRPEDFMDEEDLADLRESRGALQSSEQFGMHSKKQPVGHDPLLDMFGISAGQENASTIAPNSKITLNPEALGTKLLQRMGWKPGHGLGPKVSWKRREQLRNLLGIGREASDAEGEREAKNHLFPPPDTELSRPDVHQGVHGLGWDNKNKALTLSEALENARSQQARDNPRKSSSGFGISVLEQDSDNEDDVYATGEQWENSSLARRKNWASQIDKVVLGDNTSNQTQALQRDEKMEEARTASWLDGTPLVSGFVMARETPGKDPWYTALPIPENWQPDPQKVWAKALTRSNVKDQLDRRQTELGPRDRASILGEAAIPGPPPSILNYLSAKDRERLEQVKSIRDTRNDANQDTRAPSSTQSDQTMLDPAIAKAALLGYKPFVNDPDKQKRYMEYLEGQSRPSKTSLKPSSNLQRIEWQEFAKSASIFKPMNSIMANRFESSSSGSHDTSQLKPGLYLPSTSQDDKQAESKNEAHEKAEQLISDHLQGLSSERRNARLGNFGPNTTRNVTTWKPARLLCKRFHVPVPYQDTESRNDDVDETVADADVEIDRASFAKEKAIVSSSGVNARWEAGKRELQALASSHGKHPQQVLPELSGVHAHDEASKDRDGSRLDLANVGLGESDTAKEETTYVKPPMDLFKAVFADDDDSDSENEKDGKSEEKQNVVKQSSEQSVRDPPAKPTFIPRKRPTAQDSLQPASQQSTKKKKQKKQSGLLTFSLDDEDAVQPHSNVTRPKASDLFD